MRFLLAIWLICCGVAAAAQDVLIIGDSMLSIHQNKDGGIEEIITRETGLSVEILASAGAPVVPAKGAKRLLSGKPVIQQLGERGAPIVVVNGGANDLALQCRCGECGPTLEGILSSDSGGALGTLMRDLRDRGSKVFLVGYYAWAPGGRAYEGCRVYLEELDRRMVATANQLDGVTYVSTKEAIDPENPDHFKADGIHPSLMGAGRIGQVLAAAMVR